MNEAGCSIHGVAAFGHRGDGRTSRFRRRLTAPLVRRNVGRRKDNGKTKGNREP